MSKKSFTVAQKLLIALLLGAIIVSCKKNKVEKVSDTEVNDRPNQEVVDFEYYHTEKGVLRYKVDAKLVHHFGIKDTSYYTFPKGMYVKSFTQDSIPEADIKADSAYYCDQPRFFSATGNVVVQNFIKNMRLETNGPLYWDEAKKQIYTDASSIIIRPPDTIPALFGLIADDRFTTYTLRSVQKGVVYSNFGANKAQNAVNDTVKSK